MKHILLKSIVGSGLLLFALTASAQQYPPLANDRVHDREVLLERVQADLDRAESTAYAFTGDRDRVQRAREEVSEFQRRMDDGVYDREELNSAIVSMQRVVDRNRLYDRVRDSMVDDLNRLRDIRDRYERDYERP